MKSFSRLYVPLLAVLACVLIGTQASAQPDNPEAGEETREDMEAYIELLRKDYEVVKIDLINQAMGLSADEASVFWPIYQTYEADRKELVMQRFGVIYDLAQTIDEMTDPIADELVRRSFGLERAQTELKVKYYEIISEQLGARKAARFTQAEGQLQALVNFRLASEIPLID